MKTVDTIVNEYYSLREKTVDFAISNEAYREQALSLYTDFVNNFDEISERYNFTHFSNKLASYLNNWE